MRCSMPPRSPRISTSSRSGARVHFASACCLVKLYLGRNRFAKPNRDRFQIFGFYAVDLSNLKPVSPNRRNLLGRWFRLRNRHVTVLLLCFVGGRCEFLFVIQGKYESNTKQKSAVVIKKTI